MNFTLKRVLLMTLGTTGCRKMFACYSPPSVSCFLSGNTALGGRKVRKVQYVKIRFGGRLEGFLDFGRGFCPLRKYI